MFKLMKANAIKAAIATVVGHKAAYVESVQVCAVQCIGHAYKHGDVTLATDLVAAARKHDAHILVAYFEANGPFRYQKASKAFEKNKSWTGAFNPETLPHWETGKPVTPIKSVFDVDEAFDRFIKSCHAQLKKAASTKNVALLTMLEDTQALYNSRNAEQQSKAILAKLLNAVEDEEEAKEAARNPELPGLKAA